MGLEQEQVELTRLAASLHDLGKLAVPEEILRKPGPLTDGERLVLERHPQIGYRMLESLGVEPVAEWVLHHHERWDGTGYPDGLHGEDIPLGARIIFVADAFDAMTNDRIYRRKLTIEAALAELEDCAGTQFDPSAVAALIEEMTPRHRRRRVLALREVYLARGLSICRPRATTGQGFAAHYDRFRPRPPQELLDVLCRYARVERPGARRRPRLRDGAVDARVVGRRRARGRNRAERRDARRGGAGFRRRVSPGVRARDRSRRRTARTSSRARSRSTGWSRSRRSPRSARILRRGGVFAAYDYDWPPVVDPELDEAFWAYQGRRADVRRARLIDRGADRWPKHEHLERMRASGRFGYCREIVLHSIEEGERRARSAG